MTKNIIIMGNENEEDIVLEDIVEETNDNGEDTTDWKAIALKNEGIAKRLKTKLEKAKEAPAQKGEEKKDTLDRMDKAILRMEKITAPEEVDLIQSIMKETGKDLESVLASKFFQAELTEMRELAASKSATPEGTKRSGQAPRDSVEYWLAKGELPKDNPELARKVVNAKLHKEATKNQFTDQAVA